MSEQTGKGVVSRELLQQALDALTVLLDEWTPAREAQLKGTDAITALREALAAPMPELVAHLWQSFDGKLNVWVGDPKDGGSRVFPVYAAPPAAPAPDFSKQIAWCRKRADNKRLCYEATQQSEYLQAAETLDWVVRECFGAAAPAVPLTECRDSDSPWLICKRCAAAGRCDQASGVKALTLDYIDAHIGPDEGDREAVIEIVRQVERAHGIGGGGNG